MPPARKFLASNGRMSTRPLRELHDGGDPPEVVARIAEARAMCDEPECPSRAIVDAQGELARTYDRLRHAANVEQAQSDRKALTIEARMADAHRRAKRQHIDASHELHIMRLMLERARKGNRADPSTLTVRLEALEARLDRRPDLEEAA